MERSEGQPQEGSDKGRPYWHVDAKWISGLLLLFILSVTLLLYNLVRVTAEEPAVETMNMAMALAVSRNGLDDEAEIAALRQQLEASADGSVQPIPGLQILVREEDLAGLSPRQVRLYLFRQLAEPFYRNGPEGLAPLAADAAWRVVAWHWRVIWEPICCHLWCKLPLAVM